MQKNLFTLLLILISLPAYSIKGPYFANSKFGNVETTIALDNISSFEIEKTALCGKLCDTYIQKSINPRIHVFIFYLCSPNFTGNSSEYFLSYGKGNYELDKKGGKLLSKEGIIIRICGSTISAKTILKILDYGLNNIDAIKRTQKKVIWGYWKWESVDSLSIKAILNSQSHSYIDSLLASSKYNIISNLTCLGLTWTNEEYFISGKDNKPILRTENISEIRSLDSTYTLVFDSPNTFYLVNVISGKYYQKQEIVDSIKPELRLVAIKNDSSILLTNNNYHELLAEARDFDQFNIWRYLFNENKLERIQFSADEFFKIIQSESLQRTQIKVDIRSLN